MQALPVSLQRETDVVPLRYIVTKLFTRCLHCDREHITSQTMAMQEVNSRLNMGKKVTHLVPTSKFYYNVPVWIIDGPRTNTPACHECATEMSLDHLPMPPQKDSGRLMGLSSAVKDGTQKSSKKPVTAQDVADLF